MNAAMWPLQQHLLLSTRDSSNSPSSINSISLLTPQSTPSPCEPVGAYKASHNYAHAAVSEDQTPTRHLWLGRVSHVANKTALEAAFRVFGELQSVHVFPGRPFAFVNFAHVSSAIAAKATLDGKLIPGVSGGSTVSIRYKEGMPSNASASPPTSARLNSVAMTDTSCGLAGGRSSLDVLGRTVAYHNAISLAALTNSTSVLQSTTGCVAGTALPAALPAADLSVFLRLYSSLAGAESTGQKQFIPCAGPALETASFNDASNGLINGYTCAAPVLRTALSAAPQGACPAHVSPYMTSGQRGSVELPAGNAVPTCTAMQVGTAGSATHNVGNAGLRRVVARCSTGSTACDGSVLSSGSGPYAEVLPVPASVLPPSVPPAPASELELDGLLPEPAVNLSNMLNPNNKYFNKKFAMMYKRLPAQDKHQLVMQDRAQQLLSTCSSGEGYADLNGLTGYDNGLLASDLTAGMQLPTVAENATTYGRAELDNAINTLSCMSIGNVAIMNDQRIRAACAGNAQQLWYGEACGRAVNTGFMSAQAQHRDVYGAAKANALPPMLSSCNAGNGNAFTGTMSPGSGEEWSFFAAQQSMPTSRTSLSLTDTTGSNIISNACNSSMTANADAGAFDLSTLTPAQTAALLGALPEQATHADLQRALSQLYGMVLTEPA